MAGTVKQKIVLEGDTSSLTSGAKEASKALQGTTKALQATGVANKDLEKSVDGSTSALKESAAATKEARRLLSILDSETKKYGADSKQAQAAQRAFNAEVSKGSTAYNRARVELLKAERALEQHKKTTGKSTRETRAFERAVSRARVQVAKQETAVKRLEASAAKLNRGSNALATTLKGFASAAVAKAVVSELSEMADRSVKLTAVQQGFDAAFKNSSQTLQQARDATKGLVSDYEIQLAANKAATLGVVKSGQEFAKLADVAVRLGAAVGQDATASVSDLTTALGRQSPMILDNLGITLKVSEAQERYAERLNKTASELTDAEKKQAFITEAMALAEEQADKLGISLDGQAASVARLNTSWQNFTDGLASRTTIVLVGINDALSEGISLIDKMIERQGAVAGALRSATSGIEAARLAAKQALFDAGADQREIDEIAQIEAEEAELLALFEPKEFVNTLDLLETETGFGSPLATTDAERRASERAVNKVLREQRKKRGKKRKDALDVDDVSEVRGFSGVDLTEDVIESQNEDLERQVELLRQKQEVLEVERQAAGESLDLNQQIADNDRELLELEEQLATRRGELTELDLERRRKAAEKQIKINERLAKDAEERAKQERALQRQREQDAKRTAAVVGSASASLLTATVQAAEGGSEAVRAAVGDWAKAQALQMLGLAVKETALAVAAAASFNAPGAAAHGAAAGKAAAAAAALGAIAAAIGGGGGGGGGGGAGGRAPEGAALRGSESPSGGLSGPGFQSRSPGRSGGGVESGTGDSGSEAVTSSDVPLSRAGAGMGKRVIEVTVGQLTILGNGGPQDRAEAGRQLAELIREAERGGEGLER